MTRHDEIGRWRGYAIEMPAGSKSDTGDVVTVYGRRGDRTEREKNMNRGYHQRYRLGKLRNHNAFGRWFEPSDTWTDPDGLQSDFPVCTICKDPDNLGYHTIKGRATCWRCLQETDYMTRITWVPGI